MKRKLALVLALSTCFFAACGGGNNSTSQGGTSGGGITPSGDDVYVTVIDAGMGSQWIQDLADAYYEETGITVECSADPDLITSVETKMGTSAEKDDIYFVTEAQKSWNKWTNRGMIASIDDVLASDKYGVPANERAVDSTVLELGKYGENDETFLLPYVYSMWGLVYNQAYLDKVDSYGEYVKGQWPNSMQGLIDLCTAVKNANLTNPRTQRTVSPFSCGLNVHYMDYIFFSLWEEQDPEGYQAYWDQNDKNAYQANLLNTPAVKSAMENIYGLIGATSETNSNLVSTTQNHLESQTSFVNGDCVFTFTGSWFQTEMKKIAEETGLTDYHFAAFPSAKNTTDSLSLINMPGEFFFIPSDAENVSGAKDFLAFCISEKGAAIMAKSLNQQCVYSTTQEVELSSFGKEVKNVMQNARHAYQFSSTSQVFLTSGLNLFIQETNPFTKMAKYKVTSADKIYEQCIAPEIAQHQSLWTLYMDSLN